MFCAKSGFLGVFYRNPQKNSKSVAIRPRRRYILDVWTRIRRAVTSIFFIGRAGERKMTAIHDIRRQEQFEGYYAENGLNTLNEKINHLMDVTGVKALRGGGSEKLDVTLALLEESTLLGYWRDLS